MLKEQFSAVEKSKFIERWQPSLAPLDSIFGFWLPSLPSFCASDAKYTGSGVRQPWIWLHPCTWLAMEPLRARFSHLCNGAYRQSRSPSITGKLVQVGLTPSQPCHPVPDQACNKTYSPFLASFASLAELPCPGISPSLPPSCVFLEIMTMS